MRRKPWNQDGQAAVESAIVFPLGVFMMLGIIQLTLIQQSRLMLEYAAFNAARAGVVWNGEPAKMERAAIISLLPTLPSLPFVDDGQKIRVDEPELLLKRYLFIRGANTLGGALKLQLIKVETLNPTTDDFQNGKEEIDFDMVGDGLAARQKSQLTIRLTYFYDLRLPIINKFFFETWLAGLAGVKLGGFDPFRPNIKYVPGTDSMTVRMGIEAAKAKTNCKFSGIERSTLLGLIALGKVSGKYYMPLVTTYTMRMQSSFFKRFASAKPKSCN
ncbi:MAG: pilus assembly protein [Myxococcales bacterium]